MEYPCGWCGQASWAFRCFTCDPRSEKKLCTNCSMLWHSRGFARGHQLTNRSGLTRSYLAWGCPGEIMSNGGGRSNGNAQVEAKPAAETPGATESGDSGPANDSTDAKSVEKPAESVVQEAQEQVEATEGARQDAAVPKLTEQREEKEDESMEEEFEFEVVGESVDSGEDGDTASVEKKNDAGDEAKGLDAAESAVEGVTPVPDTTASSKEQQSEANGVQESKEKPSAPATTELELTADAQLPPVTAEPLATTAGTVQVSKSALESASLTTTTTTSMSSQAQASSAIQGDTSNFTPQSRTEQTSTTSRKEAPQPKPVALDKLLRWFPTSDNVLMDMLAARIEAALVIEDALICARMGKCEEPTCRSILLHYEHCKRNEMCGDPRCSEISIVYRHRRTCLKKDASPTSGGKQYVCPFCIRIRQRRSLGVVAALDHLIYDQRRALQNAHSEASCNFCLQSINTWTQRKRLLRAETDRLNQLASESSSPIFNFPRYRWHFSDAVSIKREPTPLETSASTSSELSGDRSFEKSANNIPAGKAPASGEDDGNMSKPDTQQSHDTQKDSMPGNVNFNADFINELLRAKTERSGDSELAQQEFDGVMELGYAIVDASFCAPSKAQRCLLNCTSILVHLQHHLDLQVCKQPMCTAVEHHFAHLSQCKAREENELCEYCLRVEERQLVRSVDFMEAQQPEAEAKVQKIINDITASFTNHRPDEREQEVIQLEDELEQAEDNKRELTDKLAAARHNLRKVRRNLEHRGISQTLGSHRLPVHFIKVRRGDGSSGNNSKKRRLVGPSN